MRPKHILQELTLLKNGWVKMLRGAVNDGKAKAGLLALSEDGINE